MTQGSKRTYTSVFDCARKIAQQEGYATFLQVRHPGMSLTLVSLLP